MAQDYIDYNNDDKPFIPKRNPRELNVVEVINAKKPLNPQVDSSLSKKLDKIEKVILSEPEVDEDLVDGEEIVEDEPTE